MNMEQEIIKKVMAVLSDKSAMSDILDKLSPDAKCMYTHFADGNIVDFYAHILSDRYKDKFVELVASKTESMDPINNVVVKIDKISDNGDWHQCHKDKNA